MSTQTENVIAEVLAERHRQVHDEAWTAAHDDTHDCHELAQAAACYCLGAPEVSREWGDTLGGVTVTIGIWPWEMQWWKPGNYRRNLVKAAALIVAEVERIDRQKPKSQPWSGANDTRTMAREHNK